MVQLVSHAGACLILSDPIGALTINNNMKYFLYAFLIGLASLAILAFTARDDEKGWTLLFNGKNLSGWDTWLAPASDSNGRRLSDQPIGLNKDPQKVFTVVSDGRDKVIRISGEETGGLITKKEYENYHLQLQFKWGVLTWKGKKNKKRDSGLLYHSVGPYGADFGAWMRSQEFQVQEGDCGDYWGCAGGMADIPAVKKTDSEYIYDPAGALYTFRADNSIGRHCIKSADAENPSGSWNTLDLYCYGDTSVHVVNGRLMMILYHSAQLSNGQVLPLTRGSIQLQSEGAEVFYKEIKIRPIARIPVEVLAGGR